MKKFTRRTSFAALLGAPVVGALPATLSAKSETIVGQVIDLGCYEAGRPVRDYTGVHARACSLEGFPPGILTADGRAYVITGSFVANSNAKLWPYFLEPSVTATGEIGEKDGRPTIAVTDIKAPKKEEASGRRG